MTIKAVHIINTGFFKLDGGAMFGVVPKAIWNKINPADKLNRCTWAMRSLLIKTEDRNILIDAGIGDKQEDSFFVHFDWHKTNELEESLLKTDTKLEDITDIFCTHLHFDHCGSIIQWDENKKPVLKFKNAKVWVNETQWNETLSPNAREKGSFLKENLLPIEALGALNFVSLEDHDFPFEIQVVNGHTKGQMLPSFDFNGKHYVFAADLVPSVGHIKLPYIMAYDIEPLKSMIEKQALLESCESNETILILQHDPVNECCTVKKDKKGHIVLKIFTLNESVGTK